MENKQGQHLVFYDGTCGMCHGVVQFLLKHDKRKVFIFAPLQGKTAAAMLNPSLFSSPDADSLVLVENYKDPPHRHFYIFGKAALRISWLMNGWWKFPGVFSFLPASCIDWFYKWIAAHRFQWFQKTDCLIPNTNESDRFLM